MATKTWDERRVEMMKWLEESHEKLLQKLADFADLNEMRLDWHEPDEQGVTVKVEGRSFDNAMGDGRGPDGKFFEKVVVLKSEAGDEVVVNLASLLAAATYAVRKAKRMDGLWKANCKV